MLATLCLLCLGYPRPIDGWHQHGWSRAVYIAQRVNHAVRCRCFRATRAYVHLACQEDCICRVERWEVCAFLGAPGVDTPLLHALFDVESRPRSSSPLVAALLDLAVLLGLAALERRASCCQLLWLGTTSPGQELPTPAPAALQPSSSFVAQRSLITCSRAEFSSSCLLALLDADL